MKAALKTFFIITLYLLVIFKGCKELFLVERNEAKLDENIEVILALDEKPRLILIPAIEVEKRLTLINKTTNSKHQITFNSRDWALYFYVEETTSGKVLQVVDPWLGQNSYEYETLVQLAGERNCLSPEDEFSYCGGFNEQGMRELGEPELVFQADGWQKP